MTSVPPLQFTSTGLVVPTEAQILAGVQADMNAAFGGNLNANLETPQGQLATSLTAIIANAYAAWMSISNNVDPAYTSGRFQDAIARIYFLTRNPALSTSLQISCSGLTGITIPVGALVQDSLGNIYVCTTAGTIPLSGSITLPFSCMVAGVVGVPLSVSIYQTIPGWDSASVISGVEGSLVESPAAFELRRQQTVAANSKNTNVAILGALLEVAGVTSAYVTDNSTSDPIAINPAAVITGYIAGNVLTLSSGSMPASPDTLSVSGEEVLNGTYIVSGTGPYTLNNVQTVGSSGSPVTLQIGGVQINSKSLYVCVTGGVASQIAAAIWSKKPPGCGYASGNITYTVYDTSKAYGSPGIPYPITFNVANALPIFFAVNLKNNAAIPSNAIALIQTAIMDAFAGSDGGLPAAIGIPIVNSRFVAGILALGAWAQILSIQMASVNDTPTAIFMGSISGNVLTVSSFTSGSGTLEAGCGLTGALVSEGATILTQTGGTPGEAGTYTLNISQPSMSGTINSYLVDNFQETVHIDQIPTISAALISVYLF